MSTNGIDALTPMAACSVFYTPWSKQLHHYCIFNNLAKKVIILVAASAFHSMSS